jgi:hypothetical protein
MGGCEEKGQLEAVGKEPPSTEYLRAEAEEFPLLEAVTRERLVKTQQAGKDSACAVVNTKSSQSISTSLYLVTALRNGYPSAEFSLDIS